MLDRLAWLLDFRWAHGLPGWAPRVFYFSFFALVVLFGLQFRRDYVLRGAPDEARWRDLRLWVVFVMAIPTVLYAALG